MSAQLFTFIPEGKMAASKPSLSDRLAAQSEAARLAADLEVATVSQDGKPADMARTQAWCAFFEDVLLNGAEAGKAHIKAPEPPKLTEIKGGR